MDTAGGQVRVGVGGWTYAPWRDNFYPKDLPQARELQYAAGCLTSIEINGTFYGTQKPESFARWRDTTPEDFVFSMKAPRFATQRRELASAGESVARFMASGISELGKKLGPVVWQLPPTKRFVPNDLDAFLQLLPAQVDGIALRHVLEARHESFRCAEFISIAREHQTAIVFTDSDDYPSMADISADLVYARLMRSQANIATGYHDAALDALAQLSRRWAAGEDPEELPHEDLAQSASSPRDVFIYFISAAKERNPAAAMALIERLR